MIKTFFILCLVVVGSFSSIARSEDKPFDTEYRIRWESRFAGHLRDPYDLASARQFVYFEQRAWWKKWTLVAGARAYAEGAFATNPRFGAPVREAESLDINFRDNYLQYKSSGLLLKLGSQQVVWGEAFGFYFADIVNPKDMREFGLNDLSDQRIVIPMVDAKIFFGPHALELVYIPKPFFSQVGAQGGDFGFPFSRFFPTADLSVATHRTQDWFAGGGEYGIRFSLPVAGFDTSLFYFDYYDRSPNYNFAVLNAAPLRVEFQEVHQRIKSVGFTFSKELGSLVYRGEALYHFDKRYDRVGGGSFAFFNSDEAVGVLAVDYSSDERRFGVQASLNQVVTAIQEQVFPATRRELITIHGSTKTWSDQTLEMVASYGPRDGSSLLQFKYTVPLSKETEVTVGADGLIGGENSQFGQFQNASRFYVRLKSFLSG